MPRRTPLPTRRLVVLLLLGALASAACHVVSTTHRSEPLDALPQIVSVPVRAHLHDGRTVLYRQGFSLVNDTLRGAGIAFGLRLDSLGVVSLLPLTHVAAMESLHQRTNVGATLLLSTVGVAAAAAATGAIAVALFGSCPTFYAAENGAFVLEAEGFSYSISPLFESRDVDLLGARPNERGELTLEVRNEALETHFINHLEVLAVQHRFDETIVPDPQGRPLALSDLKSFVQARDRSGRDVRSLIEKADDRVYATPQGLLDAVTEDDLGDWIDLAAERPAADSVALSLRMRNSLLTTVLLYDYMLAAQGVHSLNWLGRDIEVIENAIELANWYRSRMGLRVAVREGGAWREVARISATGPIAWERIAVMIPVPREDSLRLRLSFAADEWRLDAISLAAAARYVTPQVVPLSRVVDMAGQNRFDVLRHLSSPDDSYLETRPGTRFTAIFETGDEPDGESRTFLLASQGYYVEWIRSDWLRSARTPAGRFIPSDRVLLDAVRSWSAARDTLEHAFYSSRIPVR